LFLISLFKKPSVLNIETKYNNAIDQVIDWCLAIHRAFKCEIYSVYVRGSVVQGFQTIHSDIDMVVLLRGASLTKVLEFEHSIDALLSLYLYPFIVDVKVFEVDDGGSAEPAAEVSTSIRKEIKKSYQF